MDVIEIFKKLQSGEESAFNDFYNKTVKLVFYVIENVGVPRADIEDVAQEVYIQVFKHYKDVKNPDSVLSWIKQIAKTRAINHQVKYSKETVVYDEASDIVFEESEFLAPMDLPEDVMESKESRRIINDIVNKLPEKQSLVFRAFYFNEMKTKEISESISMPEGTVKVYLKRSRDFVQNEVLAFTKKHGVKIASMAIIPVFGMVFTEEANACTISTSTLSSVYKGAMSVAKGASVKVAVASKAMAGLTKALAAKIAVAVIGVAAIGGGAIAVISNMNAKPTEEQQMEASRVEEASKLEKEAEEKRQSEEAAKAEELKKQEEASIAALGGTVSQNAEQSKDQQPEQKETYPGKKHRTIEEVAQIPLYRGAYVTVDGIEYYIYPDGRYVTRAEYETELQRQMEEQIKQNEAQRIAEEKARTEAEGGAASSEEQSSEGN